MITDVSSRGRDGAEGDGGMVAAPGVEGGASNPYQYLDDVHDYILRMIPEDGKVIGAIGCGRASTEAVLVRQGREVHGVDISEEALEVARTRLTSVRLVGIDERHHFEDESLDGLILGDIIEHLPAGWEALKIFTRAVKPGGWVVISVPNMRSMNVLVQFGLLGDWPEKPMGIFDRTHLQVMSVRRLTRWCRDAGLTIERWFDRYEEPHWRGRVGKIVDPLTFRLFHEFLTFQLQCRCRKPAR